jgi:RNA polymerase sigma factor (sigma-70 family)
MLQAFRLGDRQATQQLYLQYVSEVRGSLRNQLARVGRLSPENLSDVTQEAFARAFSDRARQRFDASRALGPYLQRIARNALVDWLRRSRRDADSHVSVDDHEPSSEDQLRAYPREMLEATGSYVRALDPVLHGVLRHRFLEGEPQLAAARTLGISRQRIRTLEKRLLDDLRLHLEDAKTVRSP